MHVGIMWLQMLHYTCAFLYQSLYWKPEISNFMVSFFFISDDDLYVITKYNPSLTWIFQFPDFAVDMTVKFLFECSYYNIHGNIKPALVAVFSLNTMS